MIHTWELPFLPPLPSHRVHFLHKLHPATVVSPPSLCESQDSVAGYAHSPGGQAVVEGFSEFCPKEHLS